MSKKKRRVSNKRNLGLGRNADHAVKKALRESYGGDAHYSSRFTHYSRFLAFIDWLLDLDPPVKDLRKITLEHALGFGAQLAEFVNSAQMEVSYAQNLLSTINVVMRAVRLDQAIFVEPSKIVGKRSYIRDTLPEATWEKVELAVELAEQKGHFRGAAFILMGRAYGMRSRESALADLHRLKLEMDLKGAVLVLDGTKGGYKSEDRLIQIESHQRRALEYALSVISETGTCLVDTNASYEEFRNRCIQPIRPILKSVGIRCPHDLRAERFIDVYEKESGQLAPVKQTGPFDREADLRGRKAVSRESGHQRPTVPSSYIGKRHRTNRGKKETD
ncbi:site-specific recombinase, phage integrase family protein [Marinobacter santoriniensis NKSG1]|uniref:Site-specific recombinase, phage integrase family protein n=1 Tax=Marinobacter santoriniensis NKSG1 TaxID=1288826 RepID=M7CTQ1_9GAMM|nr:integrase domain-containing protein [Marinobacter santoriniensis]EMP56951.1 site-specific recombinase, phage integrase family protein [Marinobacter santoriniensis NKSG1]